MALYIVEDECISCGDCEPVCPTSSVFEDKIVFKITKETCTECEDDHDEPQCVMACPVENCILPMAS